MDPFEDPDSVEPVRAPEQPASTSAPAPPSTTTASAGDSPYTKEAPLASGSAADATAGEDGAVPPVSATAGPSQNLARAAAVDLHASASLFGEGAAVNDGERFHHGLQPIREPGADTVQLSALMLPPSAHQPSNENHDSVMVGAGASTGEGSAWAQHGTEQDPSRPPEHSPPIAGSAASGSSSTPGTSRRHRNRRPDPSVSSSKKLRQRDGGLSATISSLRRNVSRQIERERQQMGLSKSNLRDVYTADDDYDDDEPNDDGNGVAESALGDDIESRAGHPTDPARPLSNQDRPSRTSSGHDGVSSASKGKNRLSDSRAGGGRRRDNLGASAASVGARRRAMRVMSGKEKALWLWANVENMDAFLAEVYAYYQGKGAYCIALSRTLNLLTIAFVLVFSTFLLGCVDYSAIKHNGVLSEVIVPQCVNHFSYFAVLVLFALGAGFAWLVVRFGVGITRLVAMHGFYEHLLNIPDADVQAIPWHEVVNRISALRISNPQDPSMAASIHAAAARQGDPSGAGASKQRLSLDAHDIANRIMRQENYLIALFNKDVLNLNVPFQAPLPSFLATILGLNSPAPGVMGMGKPKPVLTRSLEWNLHFCLLGFFFDQDGQLNQAVLRERNRTALVAGLRKRLITMAMLNAILAPFIIIYLMLFSFFRYFEEYHKNPANLGSRQYTEYARWKFREFNELPHLFKRRMQSSMPFAQRYTDQFPKERLVILARFVAFIAGSFTAVLLLASLYDPDLFLHFDITPDRNTLFYIGVFGGVLAVARGMIPEDNIVVNPESEIKEVIRRTHYYPDEWRGRLHSAEVHADFGTMYMLKIYIFLTEMVSVIMTPFILWLSLPQSAPAIVDFFREFTVHVDGLGYVCSFAVFDFKRNGNVRFGAPADSSDERMASKAGKMEQSFINFKVSNPDWLPADPSGSLFLSRLTETVARQQGVRGRGPGSMDPYASALDPYASASYLHGDASQHPGRPLPESTLTARKHMYDEAFNRSILLASKPRNAEALAASATKVGSRSAYRPPPQSGSSAAPNASALSSAGGSGAQGASRSRSTSVRAHALQSVDEDGDLFGEQPEGNGADEDGITAPGGASSSGEPVDLLASLPPRAIEDSILDAPFHSFVGETGDLAGMPSTSQRSRSAAAPPTGASGSTAASAQNKEPEQPLDAQGFKALIGNLYRNGGQPSSRSIW